MNMTILDSDKVQHLIDVAAAEAEKLKACVSRLQAVRTAFQTHNPDTTGTPLEGKETLASNWIDNVTSVANDVVADELMSHKSSRHRESIALGEI
jgi:type II secretory pathway component PulL